MSKKRLVELERHLLSNGDTVRVTRFGRTYNFDRLYVDGETPPHGVTGIRKAEAYRLLEDALKRDVLELD